ncbi:ABC transporter substrate-binding protein [Halorubrum sp. DM2]|uniref:ABC transporter substrate-binding protein n=1 Tax=Halorubrum sp. DM2 TaxID=2527867 RepID=UPI0024B81923|nr:ABC transporter substrate-binding protein [Halorubrum sp. DM2]
MSDSDKSKTSPQEAPTRRDTIKYGGAVVGGGLLAGCIGDSDSDATPEQTETETNTSTEETETEDSSYSVTMAPMGTVEFEKPPERVFTDLTHHAGMALALGHGDAVTATWGGERFGPIWNNVLDGVDGVSVDWSDLPGGFNPDKELFYELDSDLHLADPAYATWMETLTADDVAEIESNIAPWFGNTFSNGHAEPPEEWADRYEYYTLWQIFEQVAQVFDERERYESLASIRSSMGELIENERPTEEERPTVASVQPYNDAFWGYQINAPGFLYSHTRPFEAQDAFAPVLDESGEVDLEVLVDVDPDVILVVDSIGGSRIKNVRSQLESDPVGEQLSAVETGRVHAGGVRNQGPILNLFQLEMTAKQLYPEQFGTWPEYQGGPYPEIPEDERLFDRQRVADIINGDS